jgi:hypothetical protein
LDHDIACNGCPPERVEWIEKIITRWWLSKMPNPATLPKVDGMRERISLRMAKLYKSVSVMRERGGPITPETLQLGIFGLRAEIDALWGLLTELGLSTPALRQDYVDQSVDGVLNRTFDKAMEIQMPGDPGGRRPT